MGNEKPINSGREIKINEGFKIYECIPVPTGIFYVLFV